MSDHDTQFVSKFWRSLFEMLKVDMKLSSAFHPQTDGQTERVNQVLEQYLRCSINYQQDNYTAYLPLAKFAYNNTLHASTQQTPFFSNYGYHLKLDLLSPSTNNNSAAKRFVKLISEFQATLKLHLQIAQESYKATTDRFRNEALAFKIRDKVSVVRRNIKTKRLCDKLDYQRLGAFVIQKQINRVAYHVELPSAMKVHLVFYV